MNMQVFQNLDLLSVGIVIAAIGILGFVVFLSDKKSISNKTFLLFSIITILWGVANYTEYQTRIAIAALWLVRIVMFLAVFQAFFLFQLFYVFPRKKVIFPFWYKKILIPITIAASLLAVSPLIFSKVTGFSSQGIPETEKGPGLIFFAIIAVGLVISGLIILFRKILKAKGDMKVQFIFIFFGAILMFALIIVFNFIFAAFLNNPSYIPLGALFVFPFILFTAYAILKHHLLGVKVVATEILTFILAVVTFAEVIFAEKMGLLIFRSGIFLLVLSFGTLLIRSVRKEVQQRERLEKLTKELEEKNQQLQKLDEFRRQVLSFAAHDMKAPISLMKQLSTLIYDGTYSEMEKIKNTAFKIKMTADRGVNMIDNFLDIRKIEEGKLEYNFEKKNFAKFAKNITRDFTLLAKQKGIEVSYESPVEDVSVEIDTDKMRQVLQNLLDNSLKYTEAGSVKVSLKEEQTTVLLKIQDTGIGMSAELLPTLFEQFHRAANVKKTIKGTGLGLYISKQIVLAHHGEIWAESDGVGRGSRFFVRLKKV